MNKDNKYSNSLHLGANATTHKHARELRRSSTGAEDKLWELLRNRKLNGKKFRRQHPIANYVLDFYCHECKLAVELDGNYHNAEEAKEYDATRTKLLNEYGIKVLRFWNDDVINKPDKVLARIGECL